MSSASHSPPADDEESKYGSNRYSRVPVVQRENMRKFRLGPAAEDEPLVFGAQGPAYSLLRIGEWIAYMKEQGIRRVCCLLHNAQLRSYKEDLLAAYGREFGPENVCWAPIADYHLCDVGLLKERILPFLKESE